MILKGIASSMILDRSMTKQFCESSVMTEYHTRKPYFMTDHDDTGPSLLQSAAASEEMWKKFELYLTPPSSPARSGYSNAEDQAPQLVPDAACVLPSTLDLLNEYGVDEALTGPDSNVPDCDRLDFDIIYADMALCPTRYGEDQKLISDCMWNGVGYKASAALRKAHNRTTSPQPQKPCPPNGCVDPRNIFPYPVGLSATLVRQTGTQISPMKRRAPVDGAETPSDSEEEIDVVTVEKGHSTLKARSNALSRIVGAIVPNEDGKLAYVTNTGSGLPTKRLVRTLSHNETDRGRTKSKYLLSTTSASGQQATRKLPTALDQSKGAAHKAGKSQNLMKMANPKLLMQRGSDSVSPVSRLNKRVLSLEGVSFCATTGARQNSMRDLEDQIEAQSDVESFEQSNSTSSAKFRLSDQKTNIAPIEIKEELDANIRMQPPNKRRRKSELPSKVPSASSSPGVGTETEQIRAAHNVLERQRREGLRTSFLTLRDEVPELQRQEKTPKVHILNKARDYCLELQKTFNTLDAEKKRLEAIKDRLTQRLEQLMNPAGFHVDCRDSDIDSDCEDSPIVSPMSSISSSLPPSPSILSAGGGYYIARRVPQDPSASTQEVVLRLEPSVSPKGVAGKHDFVSVLKQSGCQRGIRTLIAPVTKSPEITNSRGSTPSDALSDGFESMSEGEGTLL